MKKRLLSALAIGMFLFGMVGAAEALTIQGGTDVGSVDTIIASHALLTGKGEELSWVNSVLNTDFETINKIAQNDMEWLLVEGYTRIFAVDLVDNSSYYLVKVGNAEGTNDVDFLVQNLASFNWAVLNLDHFGEGVSLKDIGKVSHISEFGGTNTVPEPATIFLFGTGIAGLAGFVRRKRS